MRITSKALLAVVIAKLQAIDVWGIGQIGKFVVFILAGVLALVLLFQCQLVKSALFSDN